MTDFDERATIEAYRTLVADPPSDMPTWRLDVMRGLIELIDILDRGGWKSSCTCGWQSGEHETEADAWAQMWVEHETPCHLPRDRP